MLMRRGSPSQHSLYIRFSQLFAPPGPGACGLTLRVPGCGAGPALRRAGYKAQRARPARPRGATRYSLHLRLYRKEK